MNKITHLFIVDYYLEAVEVRIFSLTRVSRASFILK